MSELDSLLSQVLAGDRDAWQQLQVVLEPVISAMARRSRKLRSKGLAGSPDDLRDVVVAVFERLAGQDFQNLRQFAAAAARSPDANFERWLHGAVDFAIREHLRRRFGRAPKADAGDASHPQPSKRDLQSHAGRVDDHDADRALLQTLHTTTQLTALQIIEHIAREFSPEEAEAVRLYYVEERDFAEIARALGLGDEREAQRLIRRLNARLRYHFAPEASRAPGTGSG